MPEVREYAELLGIDPDREPELLWIARQGILAPLPPGWAPVETGDGEVYFHHTPSGQSLWEHPLDAKYRGMAEEERKKNQLAAYAHSSPAPFAQSRRPSIPPASLPSPSHVLPPGAKPLGKLAPIGLQPASASLSRQAPPPRLEPLNSGIERPKTSHGKGRSAPSPPQPTPHQTTNPTRPQATSATQPQAQAGMQSVPLNRQNLGPKLSDPLSIPIPRTSGPAEIIRFDDPSSEESNETSMPKTSLPSDGAPLSPTQSSASSESASPSHRTHSITAQVKPIPAIPPSVQSTTPIQHTASSPEKLSKPVQSSTKTNAIAKKPSTGPGAVPLPTETEFLPSEENAPIKLSSPTKSPTKKHSLASQDERLGAELGALKEELGALRRRQEEELAERESAIEASFQKRLEQALVKREKEVLERVGKERSGLVGVGVGVQTPVPSLLTTSTQTDPPPTLEHTSPLLSIVSPMFIGGSGSGSPDTRPFPPHHLYSN